MTYLSKYRRIPGKKYIYTLIDPASLKVRYVGSTTEPSNRLSSHLRCPYYHRVGPKAAWFIDLKTRGLRPIMQIVMVCNDIESDFWEAYFYEVFRSEDIINEVVPIVSRRKSKKYFVRRNFIQETTQMSPYKIPVIDDNSDV